jgi:aryl-alcohol dehydrogenase-like predicted oxidoreductase
MQYRKFGNTDLLVSEIGFGAWAIGGGAMIGNIPIGWGDADDEVSVNAIHAALDAGIIFFDTADIYGPGHSEDLLGKTIGKRKDIIIATKAGNVSRNNQFTVDYSKKHILQACKDSLRRLQRDVIDFYQLHTARIPHLQNGECIEAMQQLQQQGKIRYWGISLNTFDPLPEAEFFMQNKIGNGFQLVLNLLNQKALPLLKLSSENGYGVIVRMALQFGLLTGKFDKVAEFSANDHRKNRLTREVIDSSNKALEPVWHLCKKYNCSKTQLALSYILSYPGVSTIIAGIRTTEQAHLNTNGLFRLEDADMQLIEELGTTDFVEVMKLIQQQG